MALKRLDTDVTEGLKVAYKLSRKEPTQRHAESLKTKMWMFQWSVDYSYMHKQKLNLREMRQNLREWLTLQSNFLFSLNYFFLICVPRDFSSIRLNIN